MFLTRNIKSLENLSQQAQDDGKIESKLVEISNSLLINYFITTDSNFKTDLLPLLFQYVLPLTSDNLPISARVQAGSFLNRLCSLLTSFSPSCLLTVFDAPTLSGADGGGLSGYNSYGSSSNAPLTKKVYSIAAELMMAVLLLDPPAQAYFLVFLAKTLDFLPPKKRDHLIGTCNDLLLNSKIEILSRLTEDDWKILANSFSIDALSTIVTFLINNGQIKKYSESDKIPTNDEKITNQSQKNVDDNILKAIIIFLERDPITILPLLLKTGSLNFLAQFIPLIPSHIHIPIEHLIKRIINSFKKFKEDSNNASFALEITKFLMKRDRFLCEKEHWIEILNEIKEFWINPSIIISHKSSIIELFSIAAENHFIPIESLTRFFVIYDDNNEFDYDLYLVKCSDVESANEDIIKIIPTPIIISIIQLTSVYIKIAKKVPIGFTSFCLKALFDRDPLIYVAILKLLADCFNIMYKIIPLKAERILDLCMNPLPKYFVEQIAIIKLIGSIDSIEKFRYKPIEIISKFLKSPHPSLLIEIKKMVDKLELTLPISRFDWFEQSSSLVYLLRSCNPFIIIELLDYSIIPPASFPTAILYLSDCILSYSNRKYSDKNTSSKITFNFQNDFQAIELSLLLFSRSLYILIEAIKVLKIDVRYISSLAKHHTSNEWESIALSLNSLYDVVNESLSSTVFGKIISSVFVALSSTVKYLNFLSIRKATDIIKISTIFAAAFTPQVCKLVSEISQRVENAINSSEASNNSSKVQQAQNYHQEILKFFSSNFQYKHSVIVSLTAIECISESELRIVSDYIRVASNFNRIVLLMNKAATESHFLDKKSDAEKDDDDNSTEGTNDAKDKSKNDEIDSLSSFKTVFYNTFLAFKNDPDMADYVAKCTAEIPYQAWNIEEGDLLYISKLRGIKVRNLDLLDSIHKKAVILYPKSFIIEKSTEEVDSSLVLDEMSDQIRLQIGTAADSILSRKASNERSELFESDYQKVDSSQFSVVKPFSPYRGFEPNAALFFGFLWNSKRKLSDEDFMKAQEYAMLINKPPVTVSFLSYASRHGFKSKDDCLSASSSYVDVEKWMSLIKVDRFDRNTVLSFCVLSTFIRKSWSELNTNELKFIYRSLDELGYHDFHMFSIVRIFKEDGGLNRMAAESVISIDPSRFGEFPLFPDIFKGRENFWQRFDDILNAIPCNIKKRNKRHVVLNIGSDMNAAQGEIMKKKQNSSPAVDDQEANESDAANIQLAHAKSGASVSSEKAVFNNFVYSDGKMRKCITQDDFENEDGTGEDRKEEASTETNNRDGSKDESVPSNNEVDTSHGNKDNENKTDNEISTNNGNKDNEISTNNENKDNENSTDNDNSSNENNSSNSKSRENSTSASIENDDGDVVDEFEESVNYNDQQPFELNYEIATLFSRYLSPQSALSKHEQYYYLPRGVRMIDENYYPCSIELDRFKIYSIKESKGNGSSQLNRHFLHDKLISVFESSSFCDSYIFFVLLHLGLTEEEYQRCLGPLQRFTKSHPMSVHISIADLSYLSTFEKTKIVNIPQKPLDLIFSDDKYVPLSRYPSLLLTPSSSYSSCISSGSFIVDWSKPPSYTREFVSLLVSPYLPINISIGDLMTLSKSSNMKSVLFPLLYKGFEKFSLNLFDFTSPLFRIPDEDYLLLTNVQSLPLESDSSASSFSSSSSFLVNNNSYEDETGGKEGNVNSSFSIILTSDTLNKLKSYFTKVTKTTSIIAKEFFEMNPESLCKCFNTVSADAAFIEISEKLIESVINNPSYLSVAVEIMKAIIDHTELMQLCMIANSESFLNADQLICVFLMLKFFDKKLEMSKDEAFKDMWMAMKESMPEKVKDKKRLQILTMKDSVLAFAKIFNSSF